MSQDGTHSYTPKQTNESNRGHDNKQQPGTHQYSSRNNFNLHYKVQNNNCEIDDIYNEEDSHIGKENLKTLVFMSDEFR